MPIIVPIEERKKAGLTTAADAKFRTPECSGSGLEALGAGLALSGDDGQQRDNGIEERRRRAAEAIAAALLDDLHRGNIDDAAAKKAYVTYSNGSAHILHGDDGLFNRNGADAHAAFPDTVAALADTHDRALAELDNVQRGAVTPAMNERLRSDVTRAAKHVRRQGAIEQRAQSAKLQQTTARDAVAHAGDPERFDHYMATGENAISQQAKIDNLSDKERDGQIADYKSGVYRDTVNALAPHDPMRAVGWYERFAAAMTGSDRLTAEATLGPTWTDAQQITDAHAASSPNLEYASAAGANDAAGPRIINASFNARGSMLNGVAMDPANDDVVTSGTPPDSANASWSADDRDSGSPPDEISFDKNAAPPSIAEGDGGAPMPLHAGMPLPLPPVLDAWLQQAAPQDQYVIDTPSDFITRFRRALPEFVRRERSVFATSKSTEPPLEHALLVYQSLSDRRRFATRVVAAKDQHGIIFRDFDTGQKLPFGRLPQLKGFKLIIAEHTHPRPWYDPFRYTTARQGPTNLDVAMSKFYPDVHFVINAVHTNDFMDGSADESYYFGRDIRQN